MPATGTQREIRPMGRSELDLVLQWAAAEGWNPGLEDAEAFLAADPKGFLLCTVGGVPVSSISVVNHTPEFAFLGLYLCHPDARSRGHGWAVWQAGLAHAGARTVGLDGVPDQQANYAKSGFMPTGQTVRMRGALPSGAAPDVRDANATDLPLLLTLDARQTGLFRPAYMRAWLADTATRHTRVLETDAGIRGFATIRQCAEGTKIGPFCAGTAADAKALLSGFAEVPGAGDCSIDVPDSCDGFREMLAGMGFNAVFNTARMYMGPPPNTQPAPYSAVTTLELG